MKKRFLIFILVCALSIPFCACEKKESSAEPTVTTTTRSSVRSLPDYTPELREHLGVEPKSSTFDELLILSRAMKGSGFYLEDEEHHCCTRIHGSPPGQRIHLLFEEEMKKESHYSAALFCSCYWINPLFPLYRACRIKRKIVFFSAFIDHAKKQPDESEEDRKRYDQVQK